MNDLKQEIDRLVEDMGFKGANESSIYVHWNFKDYPTGFSEECVMPNTIKIQCRYFTGIAVYDKESECWRGRIFRSHEKRYIHWSTKTIAGLKQIFIDLVDGYLKSIGEPGLPDGFMF